MLLSELEKQIELGKKLAAAMNWNFDDMRFTKSLAEIQLQDGIRSSITISKRTNIKNKIINIAANDYSTQSRLVLLKYKKPPENTKQYPKQRISKDRLFNSSLEMNVILTHEELVKIEEIMDECEDIIYVAIELGTY